jgi:hypothetical protein
MGHPRLLLTIACEPVLFSVAHATKKTATGRCKINEDDDESDTNSQRSFEEDTGLTALHITVSSRLVEDAKILLENEANMHIKTAHGYTTMEWALNCLLATTNLISKPALL